MSDIMGDIPRRDPPRPEVAMEGLIRKKFELHAPEIIASVALEDLTGEQKQRKAVEEIKAHIFGVPGPTDRDMRRTIDAMLPFSGLAEFASDAALRALPLEKAVNTVLGWAVHWMYCGMKWAGVKL